MRIFRKYFLEILVIALVFVNIFLNILPAIPLAIFLVFLSLFRSGVIGAFVLSSYAAPKVLGFVLFSFGITGVAGFLKLFLFVLCLTLWLGKKTINLYNYKEGTVNLLLILSMFIFSSLISDGGDYAFIKVRDTLVAAVMSFFAYGFLFSNYEKCDLIRIGLNMILFSLLLLMISPTLNHGSGPGGLMDFGYLRQQNINALINEDFTISYHMVGFVATLGIGIIMLDSLRNKPNPSFTFICILLCIVISLYSGARQFVVTSLAIFVIWLLSMRKNGISGIMISVIGVLLFSFILGVLFEQEGMLRSVRDEGYMEASGRSVYISKGVSDFVDNPFMGIGFGRFEVFGTYGVYPHNMFVELLCETGLLGFLFIVFLTAKPLKYLVTKQTACIFILVVYFLRSMTSGGIDSNIELFSLIFAALCLKGGKHYLNNLNSICDE